jgi:hypothetical protein
MPRPVLSPDIFRTLYLQIWKYHDNNKLKAVRILSSFRNVSSYRKLAQPTDNSPHISV